MNSEIAEHTASEPDETTGGDMTSTAITATGLTKVYQEDKVPVHALRGVSIDVQEGEFVSIVGPSGSGKSTLLHLLGGLDRPSDGTAVVDGVDITQLSERELSSFRLLKLGFVFQAFNLLPVLSAVENVEFILQLQGVGKSERRERSVETLNAFGLGDLVDRRPGDMSGGQQQRVAIARAVVGEPMVLLADEPSANLDSETTKEFCDYLLKVNEERGLTILTATHDPLVVGYTKRQMQLIDGQIVT